MATQTLTVQVPEPLLTRLRERASRANRSVEAELLDVLTAAVPPSDELPADLAEALTGLEVLDESALRQAAAARWNAAAAHRLEELHHQRQDTGLSPAEDRERADLLRQYERTMLVRARAAELLRRRGLDPAATARP